MNRRHINWFLILIAGLVLLWQYFGSEKFVNPETPRAKTRVGMSTSSGDGARNAKSSAGARAIQQIISSGPDLEVVKRVASRLAANPTGQAGADFQWQVSLIRDNQVNAFCLPGGKIVVYTGILPVAQNEAAWLRRPGARNGARHFTARVAARF